MNKWNRCLARDTGTLLLHRRWRGIWGGDYYHLVVVHNKDSGHYVTLQAIPSSTPEDTTE